MCILSYIYDSYSLELGEDIELFCVVQDFLMWVASWKSATTPPAQNKEMTWTGIEPVTSGN